jgi:hypothetical protein
MIEISHRETRRTLAQQFRLLGACAAVGAAYVACYGALLGMSIPHPVVGALAGGLLGATIGAYYGVVAWGVGLFLCSFLGARRGAIIGWLTPTLNFLLPLPWKPARFLAELMRHFLLPRMPSLIPPLMEIGRAVAQATGAGEWGFELAFVVIPALLAGCIGAVVVCSLQAGRSRVPGVNWLVAVVGEPRPQRWSPARLRPTREMVPAHLPEGRGDEPSPANLPSAGTGGDA